MKHLTSRCLGRVASAGLATLLIGAAYTSVAAAPSQGSELAAPASVQAGGVVQIDVAGQGGVSANASSAALQFTVTQTRGSGFLTAFPCGTARPNASVLNFEMGDTRTNLSILGLGSAGRVCVYSSASVELIVDVVGWFEPGGSWRSITPVRATDTRRQGRVAAARKGSVVRVPVTAPAEVANSTVAAALNVTAVDGSEEGYLTVFPCDQPVPLASSVNFEPLRPTANMVVAAVRAGEVCVYVSADVNVIVDVLGWSASTSAFSAVMPSRMTDTRIGEGGVRLMAGETRTSRVGQRPVAGGAALVNITATGGRAGGYLTSFPCASGRPTTSNVNISSAGSFSNLAIVAPDSNGDICVYSYQAGELIVDLNGWLNPSSGFRASLPARLLDTRQTDQVAWAPSVTAPPSSAPSVTAPPSSAPSVTAPPSTAPSSTMPATTPKPSTASPTATTVVASSSRPPLSNDQWLFKGDSITVMSVLNGDILEGLIRQMEPGRTPDVTNAAVGGTDALKALQSIDNELALFPGQYVVLAYGTNDYPPTFAMESLVQRVIAAGKTPVVPLAPWNDYPLTNIQNVNAQITSLYGRYPQILRGPDLYSAFLGRTDLLRASGDVHPNAAGQALIRDLWAQAITSST